jgi:hypothetical protein
MDIQQERVFGIGLSKTGTTSLTRALRILGYRTNHFPYSALRYESGRLRLDIDRLHAWDAVTDSPAALFFRRLEERFPDARFILTQRDMDSWLRSCRYNHVWPGEYVGNKAIRRLPHIRKILCLHRCVFGSERFDVETFRTAYESHRDAVIEHFRRRNRDLLVMDICGGDAWEPLCGFLGKPVPNVAFPHENVGRFKRLKQDSRRASWRLLSMLPTPTLNERHVRQITASEAGID